MLLFLSGYVIFTTILYKKLRLLVITLFNHVIFEEGGTEIDMHYVYKHNPTFYLSMSLQLLVYRM